MMSLAEMESKDEWNKKYKPSFGMHSEAEKSLKTYINEVKPADAIESQGFRTRQAYSLTA